MLTRGRHILRTSVLARTFYLLFHFLVISSYLELSTLPFTRLAYAEGGGECEDCKGGGGGGGGGKAAEILMGLAAIMAAVAPMVAAAIQADADKQIAKTNAAAQIAMTNISANQSKYLADQQKNIALTQADKQAQINKENQDSVTARLTMQLNELNKARTDAQAFEEKKQAYAQNLDQQRIDLAKQQFDQTQKLANMQMRAQLTAAGLSTGIVSTQDSGSKLAVNPALGRTTGATNLASNTGFNGTGTSLTSSGNAVGVKGQPVSASAKPVGNSAFGVTVTGNTAAKAQPARGATGGNVAGANGGITPNPLSRLVTMADDELKQTAQKKGGRGIASQKSKPQAKALLRAISTTSASVERGVVNRSLGKVMARGIVRGSTSEAKAKSTAGQSNLSLLTAKAIELRDAGEPARPHRNTFEVEPSHSATVTPVSAAAGYNPPPALPEESGHDHNHSHGGISVR